MRPEPRKKSRTFYFGRRCSICWLRTHTLRGRMPPMILPPGGRVILAICGSDSECNSDTTSSSRKGNQASLPWSDIHRSSRPRLRCHSRCKSRLSSFSRAAYPAAFSSSSTAAAVT